MRISRRLLGLVAGFSLAGLAHAQSTDAAIEQARAALEREDYAAGYAVLEQASAAGNADAQYLLGRGLVLGAGLVPDMERARRLLEQAAGSGQAEAMNLLGQMYVAGRGVAADPGRGLQYLAAAAEAGDPAHQFDYASALEADGGAAGVQQAADWYRRAADAGHTPALTSLAVLYLQGRGVAADPAMAITLLETAVEAGDARAQNNLGTIYSRGEFLPQDYAQALLLFEAAAEQGLPGAMRNLSVLYENGFGVAVDEAHARALLAQARTLEAGSFQSAMAAIGFVFDPRLREPDWMTEIDPAVENAARAGDPVALYASAFRYLQGLGVRRDVNEAMNRLNRAAEAGLGSAALNLGMLYADGTRVPQDFERAYFWFAVSAQLGVNDAVLLRDLLSFEMSAQAVTRAQAAAREFLSENAD